MTKHIPVEGRSGFYRDSDSTAIVNKDRKAYLAYMQRKKKVEDNKYDKIFVDLNDDQYCIDLAAKNINSLKRILKPNGTITAQVGRHRN